MNDETDVVGRPSSPLLDHAYFAHIAQSLLFYAAGARITVNTGKSFLIRQISCRKGRPQVDH